MSIRVAVKWMGKETFKDVDLNLDESPAVFKAQLASLSGVLPDRMKLMLKGKIIKDDDDWRKLGVTEASPFTMMGTASEIPKPPEQKTVFMEDMSEDQASKAEALAAGIPAGLENLGNTCYMNATLEVLRAVPELKNELLSYSGSASDQQHLLTIGTRDVLRQLESGDRVSPILFYEILKKANPTFAQTGPHGENMQQDADECMSVILSSLATKLKVNKSNDTPAAATTGDEKNSMENVIDELFRVNLTATYKCTESDAEPVTTNQEPTRKLSCYIKPQMTHLYEGLKASFNEPIMKRSQVLNREATFNKELKISRLPPYLQIQFVRFFWKSVEQVKTKILKRITFPFTLDMIDFVDEELKKKIVEQRAEMEKLPEPPTDLSPAQCVNSGYYELIGVLTHQGRSADSGHYIAWVKENDDRWWKFDDDTVTAQPSEEIMKLVGGGDWHMAYLCLYRAIASPHKPKKPAQKTA